MINQLPLILRLKENTVQKLLSLNIHEISQSKHPIQTNKTWHKNNDLWLNFVCLYTVLSGINCIYGVWITIGYLINIVSISA